MQKEKYVCSLQNRIGYGTTGKVYLGYHVDNPEKLLAFKIVSIEGNAKSCSELKSKIDRETKILKNLKNKNIVEYYEYFLHEKKVYMIFEYCNEGDLEQFLKNHNASKTYISEQQTHLFMLHIVHGYKELYEKGIVHRDLKLSNIFLHNGEAKIGDFDTARYMSNDNKINQQNLKLQPIECSQCVGSMTYMSPEVYNSKIYDSKCDVWSFGVMIYEFLYGKPPWKETNHDKLDTEKKNLKLQFPKYPRRSLGIKLLLRKMLTPDQNNRCDWPCVFERILNYQEILRNPVSPEAMNSEKTEIVRRKHKPAIGVLNECEISPKKLMKKNSKNIEEIQNFNTPNTPNHGNIQDIFFEEEENNAHVKNSKLVLTRKNQIDENRIKIKSLGDDFYFCRNLAIFYENCLFLLNLNKTSKAVELNMNDCTQLILQFDNLIYHIVNKAHNSYNSLKEFNSMSIEQLKRIYNELNIMSKSNNAKSKSVKGPYFC